MAILTDGVGCGSPGGKWPGYPAVFCVPMLRSVFCTPMLCSVYSDSLSVWNCGDNCFQPWCVDGVCGWGV